MGNFEDDAYEWDEQPDEYDLEDPRYDLGIPDVYWAKDIDQIENPILREKEIDAAKKLIDKENELNAKFESGELSAFQTECAYDDLRKEKSAASTRSALASVGLTYDHLADAAEQYDWLTIGDHRVPQLADEVRRTVERIGPENTQELANEMLKEGKIDKKMYDHLMRQARLSSLK